MTVDWEKVKQLRMRFENARDDYHRKKEKAEAAQKLAGAACVKVVKLETELQEIVIQ